MKNSMFLWVYNNFNLNQISDLGNAYFSCIGSTCGGSIGIPDGTPDLDEYHTQMYYFSSLDCQEKLMHEQELSTIGAVG